MLGLRQQIGLRVSIAVDYDIREAFTFHSLTLCSWLDDVLIVEVYLDSVALREGIHTLKRPIGRSEPLYDLVVLPHHEIVALQILCCDIFEVTLSVPHDVEQVAAHFSKPEGLSDPSPDQRSEDHVVEGQPESKEEDDHVNVRE